MQINQSSFAYRAQITAATLSDRKAAQLEAQSQDMRLKAAARAVAAEQAATLRAAATAARAEVNHIDSHGYGLIRRYNIAA